ncbi:uncharacterized protein TNCV_2075501 [Trichonephila clavipes]|nr:uncharacterized protein TNCV_2075501 [Trichonephila clavipes]
MSRTTACYKMKYGLAKTIKENIIKTLKETPFSLNLDESTSNAQESILAILVQFYDNNQNEVVVHHFVSLKMESCNSEAVFKAVVNTIEDNNIPWANLISVLMDSCNTMREKKKGVETRLRSNKAPHLLDIDALDPELRGKTSTILAFEKLSFMSHIFSDNEKSKVEAEIRLYQSDNDITKEMLYTSDESGNQVKCIIDKYWSKVFNLKDDFTNDYKYPIYIG